MDPLSATASLLTVLGTTGGTIKVIYDLVNSLVDGPREIGDCVANLQSFCSTITILVRLCDRIPNDLPMNLDLYGIERFAGDAKAVETKLKKRHACMTSSKAGRVKETCRLLLFDRQIKKFFESLERWNMVLNQALWIVQITLSTRILEDTSSFLVLRNAMSPSPVIAGETSLSTIHQLGCANVLESRIRQRRTISLEKLCEPTGSVSTYRYKRDFWPVGFTLRGSRVIVKTWSTPEQETLSILPQSWSISCSITSLLGARSRWCCMLHLIAYRAPASPSSLNSRISVRWHRTLPHDSPCLIAVQRNDMNLLQHQISEGDCKLSDCGPGGNTLLHFAAGYNRPAIVSMLVNAGMDVNANNDCGETPLHLVIQRGIDYECARLLLDNGADPSQQDVQGRSPLHQFYNPVVQQILLLQRESIDPYLQDCRGMTILHWVAWSRRSNAQQFIWPTKQMKGSSNLSILDAQGKSILHYAVQRGNLDLIRFLLNGDHSTTLSRPDYSGRTLLHYATESGKVETIDMLRDKGFRLVEIDNGGRTVLHHAAIRGNLAAAQRLVELGVIGQIPHQDHEHQTPEDLAKHHCSDSVLHYLQATGRVQHGSKKTATTPHMASTRPRNPRFNFLQCVALLLIGLTSLIVYKAMQHHCVARSA